MMLYLEQVGIVSRKVTQQCKVEKILGSVQNTIVFSVFRPWQCDWEWVVHWTQNLQEAVRQDVDWPRRWPHAPSRITKSEHHLARCKADQGGYSEKRPCPSNHVPLLWHNHLNQISFGYPPENLKGSTFPHRRGWGGHQTQLRILHLLLMWNSTPASYGA